jgi:hypothetical protein
MDRSLVETSNHHENAAKEELLYMVRHESMPVIQKAAQVLLSGSIDIVQPGEPSKNPKKPGICISNTAVLTDQGHHNAATTENHLHRKFSWEV